MAGMNVDLERVAELATLLDGAAGAARFDELILCELLRNQDLADTVLQQLANAFRHSRGRRACDERVGPMLMLVDDGAEHRLLADAPDEECELWAAVAAVTTHPSARAWLHDVLFERRWSLVGEHRRLAFEAYMQTARSEQVPSLRTVDALRRAQELAKLGKAAAEMALVREEALGAAAVGLGAEESKPGVDLGLLRLVVDARDVPRVDELLDHARQRYTSVHNRESVIGLQLRRSSDPARREELNRALVMAWVDEARAADPLVRILHFERAAQIARDRGLPDLAAEVVVEMQQTEKPVIPTIRVEVPSTVTQEQVESLIESLVGDTFVESVGRILVHGPPTGEWERNQEMATEMAEEHSLSAFFPVVRIGADGLPRHSPGPDGVDEGVADIERLTLGHYGQLLAEALRRAVERHAPTREEVAEGLVADGCPAPVADRIARALRRYADGDYEGCAYTALPLVERLARDLLLSIGKPVYRVQQGETRGQYDGLGAMIEALSECGLDPSWYRYLRFLLTAPDGANLRNEALHGFMDNIGDAGAAYVLIAVLYLTCLGHAKSEASPAA